MDKLFYYNGENIHNKIRNTSYNLLVTTGNVFCENTSILVAVAALKHSEYKTAWNL